MKTSTIEELAYLMQEAKAGNAPDPIFFLGAGASRTSGVPLAKEIVADKLDRYPNNPKVNSLTDGQKTYPKLMESLTPNERNKLLKEYIDIIITDDYQKDKINALTKRAEQFNNTEVSSSLASVYFGWGYTLGKLADSKSDEEAEALYRLAFEKYRKAIDMSSSSYNLACLYAIKRDKENALKYLGESLANKDLEVTFVKDDRDWQYYIEDEDFLELLSNYA